jgi:hypothetical protein
MRLEAQGSTTEGNAQGGGEGRGRSVPEAASLSSHTCLLSYLRFDPRLASRWLSALAAAVFDALLVLPSRRTLDAMDATLLLVTFFATGYPLFNYRLTIWV